MMDVFLKWLPLVFHRLTDHSLELSVLICLIFLFKYLVSKKIPSWWHYSIWMILIVRMLLPLEFENRLNVFNFLPVGETSDKFEPLAVTEGITGEYNILQAEKQIEPSGSDCPKYPVRQYAPIIWFAGGLTFYLYVLIKSFSLYLFIRKKPIVTDPKILSLMAECKRRMKIRRSIPIVVTDNINCPALFGFFRPRLLLPEKVFKSLSDKELFYAFMHELGHLKRYDIGVLWLTAFLQAAYWFNPLVWLAFHQMRLDQESACDAVVLSCIKDGRPSDYAQAIIGFLEKFYQNRRLPSLAGILESKAQMERRIERIVRHQKKSWPIFLTAILLLVIAGGIVLAFSGSVCSKAKDLVLFKEETAHGFDKQPEMGDGYFYSREKFETDMAEGQDSDRNKIRQLSGAASELTEHTGAVATVIQNSRNGYLPDPDSPSGEGEGDNEFLGNRRKEDVSESNATGVGNETVTEIEKLLEIESRHEIEGAEAALERDVLVGGLSVSDIDENLNEISTACNPALILAGSRDSKAAESHPMETGFGNALIQEKTAICDIQAVQLSGGESEKESLLSTKETGQQNKKNDNEFRSLYPHEIISISAEYAPLYSPLKIIRACSPRYPYIASRDNISGQVTVEFVVDANGRAKSPTVVASEPEGIFEESAIEAIEAYVFEPCIKNGTPVDVKVSLPIKFSLS